jgi:hypothetical protein
MEAGADLEQARHPATDPNRPARRRRDPAQDLQERRFAGTVAADVADHRPQTTDHRPQTTDHRPQTTDHRQQSGKSTVEAEQAEGQEAGCTASGSGEYARFALNRLHQAVQALEGRSDLPHQNVVRRIGKVAEPPRQMHEVLSFRQKWR